MTDQTTALALPASSGLTSGEILRGLHTVKTVLAPDLSDDELKLFAMVAARSGLDPFAKQVYAVKRKGRVTFQTGIDGYRSIAARTGLYDGQDEPEYGPVCGCGDKRPDGHPESATIRVYRKGVGRPIGATAYWHEYKPAMGDKDHPQDMMWVKMPRVMLAKVAEALALRKAFPYDPDQKHGIGTDLYTTEEMAQADRGTPASAAPALPTARERVAARRQAAEQPPMEAVAETTDDGRPIDADGVIEGEATDASPDWTEPPPIPTMEEIVEAGDTAGIDTKALAKRVLPQWIADNTPHATRKPNDAERVVLMAAIKRGERA